MTTILKAGFAVMTISTRKSQKQLVSCPVCSSHKVEKALMAPSVATGRQKEKIAIAMSKMAT